MQLQQIEFNRNIPRNSICCNCIFIRSHVNAITTDRIPWDISVVLPESSDKHALSLGLLDTDLPLEEARKKFYITDIALEQPIDETFSQRIRSKR